MNNLQRWNLIEKKRQRVAVNANEDVEISEH